LPPKADTDCRGQPRQLRAVPLATDKQTVESLSASELTPFCVFAYSKRWFKSLERQNPSHFDILRAIIAEIEDKNGGDISKADLFHRNPEVQQRVAGLDFDVIPSRGQLL
jgi:hypothetical protein